MEEILINEIAGLTLALHAAGFSRHGHCYVVPKGEGTTAQCWTLRWFREATRREPEIEARLADLPQRGHVIQLVSRNAEHTLEIAYSMKGRKLDVIRLIGVGHGDEDGALMWWLTWAIEVRKSFSGEAG